MLLVYGAAGSSFTQKVRVMLAEKGLAFQEEMVIPVNVSAEYRKIHPLGKIPSLRDGDITLADSSVICAYLEKKYPDPPLYPEEPYLFARALWFEEYADSAIAQNLGGKVAFPRLIAPMIFQKAPDLAAIEKAFHEVSVPIFDYLESEARGPQPIVGDRFSIADIALRVQLAVIEFCGFEIEAAKYPNLRRYYDWLGSRPSLAESFESCKKAFQSIP